MGSAQMEAGLAGSGGGNSYVSSTIPIGIARVSPSALDLEGLFVAARAPYLTTISSRFQASILSNFLLPGPSKDHSPRHHIRTSSSSSLRWPLRLYAPGHYRPCTPNPVYFPCSCYPREGNNNPKEARASSAIP